MRLVTSLAAGIVGAELGSAELRVHGSSALATCYSDFEGASSTPATVSLDSNGGAVVYVDSIVDVIVKSSDGTTIRTLVEGSGDSSTEVISQSFTGTDYETGKSAANKPTTLREVLDAWIASAGQTDFKVSFDGAATNISDAISAVSGIFFNVQASAYGATGDGVTDDTTAIAAAITAADAAGGGIVFFPAGTYRTTSALTLPNTVSLLGISPDTTSIKVDHASNNLLAISGSSTFFSQSIENLLLGAASSNTGYAISCGANSRLTVRNCAIGTSSNSPSTALVTASSGEVIFDGCKFTFGGTTSKALVSTAAARLGSIYVRSCFVSSTATQNVSGTSAVFQGANIHFRDTKFDASASTSGTFNWIYAGTTAYGSVVGCEFNESGGATVVCMALGTLSSDAEWFYEDGNILSNAATNTTLYSLTHSSDGYYVHLGTRISRYLEISTSSTTVALTAAQTLGYGVIAVSSTAAGNTTISAAAVGPMGAKLSVSFSQQNATARDIVVGTNMAGPTASTVAAYYIVAYEFVAATMNNGSSDVSAWYGFGSTGAYPS